MPTNPSFEMPSLPPGTNDTQDFTQCAQQNGGKGCWADAVGNFGPAGIYHPTALQYVPSSLYNGVPSLVPDGKQAAFAGGNSIFQIVNASLQLGTVYQFSAWVGAPLTLFDNKSSNSPASFDIRIADGPGGPVVLDISGLTAGSCSPSVDVCGPPLGSWTEVMKSFVLPVQGPIGNPEIALSGGGPGSQVDFDAINLAPVALLPPGDIGNEFVPLPDPSSAFTMVFKGDVRAAFDPNVLLRLSTDPLSNPWAYLGGTASVTPSLDNAGNTDVTFQGSFPIRNTDFFCAGGPPCNGLPHFGLETAELDSLQMITQFWTDEASNQLPSLTVDGPALTGSTTAWAVLFADVTTGGNTVGQWWEVPYTSGASPLLSLFNNTGSGETLSDVGFLLSETQIPLDDLNFGKVPPPGTPGSAFFDLPSLDGLYLPGGGSNSFTATPEPSALWMLGIVAPVCAALRMRGRGRRHS
jgi:hypothetical protein